MYYLITYDISSPKRQRRIVSFCKDYGQRIQKSVFECHLTQTQFETLWESLLTVANPKEDHIIAYPICQSCIKNVHQFPRKKIRSEKPLVYVF